MQPLTIATTQGDDVHVLLLADGETSRAGNGSDQMTEKIDTRFVAATAAAEILGCRTTETLLYPDNRLDSVTLLDIVKSIEQRIEALRPGVVFVHNGNDVNVDHRRVHEAALAACRPQPGHPVKELLFYEVPSSTEWRPAGSASPFVPNVFYDVCETFGQKVRALDAYVSEMRQFPHPRSLEAVEALAKWRGATVGMARAEAFVLGRRIVG